MISRACLVVEGGECSRASRERLRAEFPTVVVEMRPPLGEEHGAIDARAWLSASSFERFDRAMHGRSTITIAGEARDVERAALEVLTRYQRLIGRRNWYSSGRDFDRLLDEHARAHDRKKPLVAADHDHALDAWQWMLRLEPQASAAAQIAALMHDIERLVSESDARIEHHAPDYQAFKDAHARRGAELAAAMLARADFDPGVARRACDLIARHERPGDDAELRLLNDADALSFFSLNSEGYLRYFGPAQARRKVAYTARRLDPRHRPRLREMRLVPEIARALAEELERCGS